MPMSFSCCPTGAFDDKSHANQCVLRSAARAPRRVEIHATLNYLGPFVATREEPLEILGASRLDPSQPAPWRRQFSHPRLLLFPRQLRLRCLGLVRFRRGQGLSSPVSNHSIVLPTSGLGAVRGRQTSVVGQLVNLAPPVGNLNSPLFGRSNALLGGWWSSSAANRRIDLQVRFAF